LKKIKPKLTINDIGKFRFYWGILLGFIYGFYLNIWLRLIDSSFFIVLDLSDHYNLSLDSFTLSSYNSFLLAFTSSALGFCITMYVWTSRPISVNRKITFKNRIANTNSMFIFMLVLFILTKFISVSSILLYRDHRINLENFYGYTPFLLPVFIFLFNWLKPSQYFKSKKLMWYSAAIVFGFGIFLAKNQIGNILITGYTNAEMQEKIDIENEELKLLSGKVLGTWTEDQWVGIDTENLPPPPPLINPAHDSLLPPYYEISDNQIKHFFLGIDSTSYTLNRRNKVLFLNSLRTDLIGYQKEWRILSVSDTTMAVERRFSSRFYENSNYTDGSDTINFIRKE